MKRPRDPLELDPETFVASRVVLSQKAMRSPPALPGMTDAVKIALVIRDPSPELKAAVKAANGKLGVLRHRGPICKNCNCGRKA